MFSTLVKTMGGSRVPRYGQLAVLYRGFFTCRRCCDSTPSRSVRPISRLQRFVFGRYMQYLQSFERFLETGFPSAYRMYRVFSVGIKQFVADVRRYAGISWKVHSKGLLGLTRPDLELYFQMPRDMKKVAPVLLVSALPLAQNVVFPLAYMFPRQLLSRHFWSLQQRAEFALYEHRARAASYRSVLRHLQARVESIESEELRDACCHTLDQLGSGLHPSTDQIVGLQPLFDGPPYGLRHITALHVRRLMRAHGLSLLTLRRRTALREHGELLWHMDSAMMQEELADMSMDELNYACYLRGLNPRNLSREQLAVWLQDWTAVSDRTRETALSLLLHCPILLSYNHFNNWLGR